MAYATLAQVRDYLDLSDTSDDALLNDLIDRAEKFVDEYVGFAFEPSDTSEVRSFSTGEDVEGNWLYFDKPIAAITVVKNNADAATPDTVVSSNYITAPRNETPYYAIKLLESAGLEWTYTNDPETGITVQGEWVYSSSAPMDITDATVRLVKWKYRQREGQGETDRPLLTGDGVTILPSQVPSDVLNILNRYRSWNVGFR